MTENAGRPSAAHRVYAVTKELILNGELPAGSLISEGDIAERVQVSRTPVREAFLRLEAEELLALHPKRGAVVVPVPPGEAGLRELIARQLALAASGEVSGFAAADEAFHRGIVEASGNRLAARFYATLGDRQRRMSVSALRLRPHRLRILASEHETLLGHLVAGASDAFAETLRANLVAIHGSPGVPGTES